MSVLSTLKMMKSLISEVILIKNGLVGVNKLQVIHIIKNSSYERIVFYLMY